MVDGNITENVTAKVTEVVTMATRVGAKEGIGDKFNPINLLHKVSIYIQDNRILFSLLVGFVILIAMGLAYVVWEEWAAIPAREKSIRVGKTNIIAVFLEELKRRLKQKKKFG